MPEWQQSPRQETAVGRGEVGAIACLDVERTAASREVGELALPDLHAQVDPGSGLTMGEVRVIDCMVDDADALFAQHPGVRVAGPIQARVTRFLEVFSQVQPEGKALLQADKARLRVLQRFAKPSRRERLRPIRAQLSSEVVEVLGIPAPEDPAVRRKEIEQVYEAAYDTWWAVRPHPQWGPINNAVDNRGRAQRGEAQPVCSDYAEALVIWLDKNVRMPDVRAQGRWLGWHQVVDIVDRNSGEDLHVMTLDPWGRLPLGAPFSEVPPPW